MCWKEEGIKDHLDMQDETNRKWGRRCSTDEKATQAALWWCPLGPTAIQAKGPDQGKKNSSYSTPTYSSLEFNLYHLYYVGGASCQDSGDRSPTLQSDCIHVKDKTLKILQDEK